MSNKISLSEEELEDLLNNVQWSNKGENSEDKELDEQIEEYLNGGNFAKFESNNLKKQGIEKEIEEMLQQADQEFEELEDDITDDIIHSEPKLTKEQVLENLVEEQLFRNMNDYKGKTHDEVREALETENDFSRNIQLMNEQYEREFERKMTLDEEIEFHNKFNELVVNKLEYGKNIYVEESYWDEVSQNINNEGEKKKPDFYKENSERLNWEEISQTNGIDTDIYFENQVNLKHYKDELLNNPNVFDDYLLNYLEKEKKKEKEKQTNKDFTL